jgi:hypothetical protein
VTYRHLLRQHGHLVPVKPGEKPEPLPCAWPKRPESLPEPLASDSTDPGVLDVQRGAERAGEASGVRSTLADAIRTRTVEVLRLTHPTPAQLAVFAEVWDADLLPWLLTELNDVSAGRGV